MRILAIETSCDDTAISVLNIRGIKNPSFKVLSNIVASQIEIHKKYGGVFPMMAKREHQKNLVPVLDHALKQAKLLNFKSQPPAPEQILNSILEREPVLLEQLLIFLKKYNRPKVDLIAVTNGPGLEPCLWVGVNFARALSYSWNIPLIPVNHIEAHILVNFLENKDIKFPAISLVVSGGHTQLILVKKIGDYKIIGETRDDAAGECFDKTAKILGLEYPGGPIISKIASEIKESSIKLPRPMMASKDYDFSFSGLKTAVLYTVRDQQQSTRDKSFIQQMCFAVQQAVIDILIKKTTKAAKDYKAKTIILGGGVSANEELRHQFKSKVKNEKLKIDFIAPEMYLSTDNALMIAITGYFNRNKKIAWQKLEADANLRIEK